MCFPRESTKLQQRNLVSRPSTISLWDAARRGYNSSTNDDNASDGNDTHKNGEVEMGKGTSRDVFVALLQKRSTDVVLA